MNTQKKIEAILWAAENYTEDFSQCHKLILDAEKKSAATFEDLIEGCKVLRGEDENTTSIEVHLELIKQLSNVGVSASKAGIILARVLMAYRSQG